MNFREFLEALSTFAPSSREEAYERLGLPVGSDQKQIDAAARGLWRQHHPDLGGNREDFERVQSAYEYLVSPDKQTASYGGSSGPRREPTPNVPTRDRPDGAPVFSEEGLRQWAGGLVQANYLQAVIKEKLENLPVFEDYHSRDFGRQVRTFRLSRMKRDNVDGVLGTIQELMRGDGATYPRDIVVMKANTNWKQGWVTYVYPLSESQLDIKKRTAATMGRMMGRDETADAFGYRSVVFKLVKKAQKKVAGQGMTSHDAHAYLLSNGLQMVGSGTKNKYYGLPEHSREKAAKGYLIKLQPKVFLLVKRYKLDRGYKKEMHEIKLESVPYGKITPEILDRAIQWVKNKYQKQGLGEEEKL